MDLPGRPKPSSSVAPLAAPSRRHSCSPNRRQGKADIGDSHVADRRRLERHDFFQLERLMTPVPPVGLKSPLLPGVLDCILLFWQYI